MKKELFVCDSCDARKRLDRAERHWCDVCTKGSPVEMRHVRDKKPLIPDGIATLVSPMRVPLKRPQPLHANYSLDQERDFALR
jgi:hypothetical protein